MNSKIRIDSAFAQGWSEVPAPHLAAGEPLHSHPQPGGTRLSDKDLPRGYRAHAPSGLRGPHFDPSRVNPPVKTSTWVGIFGQILAYLGAAVLTGGAGLVLVGYLGGPTHYAPTGWFTTIVGQMLLFLGVVTLVSAGMEQTTVEVATRIDTLGERLDRIEHTSFANAIAAEAELEAELRAEIASLREQLNRARGQR